MHPGSDGTTAEAHQSSLCHRENGHGGDCKGVFIRTSHTGPAPLQSEGEFRTSNLSVWTPIEEVFVFVFFNSVKMRLMGACLVRERTAVSECFSLSPVF